MFRQLCMMLFCIPLLTCTLVLAFPLKGSAIKASDSGYAVDIYEPKTDVNAAPIVMQRATATTINIANQTKRPSALIFDIRLLDGTLTAYDGATNLGAFASLYTANCQKANIGARVSFGDTATATALANYAREHTISNLWVISNDVSLLQIVTDAVPMIRGVVDFTQNKLKAPWQVYYSFDDNYAAKANTTASYITYTNGYAALTDEQIYNALFAKGYRTALIPAAEATKAHLEYLAGNHIFTIAQVDKPSKTAFYDLIVAGVNGILSDDYTTNIAVLESELFDVSGEEIVIRGGHVMAHRGDTGNLNVYPENSLPAILSAAASGATSVEFDVRLTKDKHLVIVHDNTATRQFRYAEGCPLSTNEMESNYNLPISQRNWEGDLEYMVYRSHPSIRMCQLYELYEAIDTEYPHLFLATEIKPKELYDYETMNYTIELMDQYHLRHRSFLMAANVNVPKYATAMGVNCRWLYTPPTDSENSYAYVVENAYRAMNSGMEMSWEICTPTVMEQLKHFGNIATPSPIDAAWKQRMDTYYTQGYYGMTTNMAHWSDRYVKDLIPSLDPKTGTITAKAHRLTYKHQPKSDTNNLNKYWIDNGWVTEGDVVEITNFEIIAIAGNPVIDQANKTVKGGAGDEVALRTKVTLKGLDTPYAVSYYVYSAVIELSTVDRSALQNAVNSAQKLVRSAYNTDGWSILQNTLTQAQKTLGDTTATQNRLHSAEAALRRAVANLVTGADRTKLTADVREALALTRWEYSEKSWNSFIAALDRAQTVLADKTATQTAVNNVQASLKTAKEALNDDTVIDDPSSTPPSNTTSSDNTTDKPSGTTTTSKPHNTPSSEQPTENDDHSQANDSEAVADNEQQSSSPTLGIILAVIAALTTIGGGIIAFLLIRKRRETN